MNETFARMISERKVVIFMDDIIVHGKTREELTANVSEFLQKCKDEDLRLKIAKSTFSDTRSSMGSIRLALLKRQPSRIGLPR